ncbi:MAG: trigger factor [Schaedlerella sp.]|nr:trigger factor [Schaedlerella sp.]
MKKRVITVALCAAMTLSLAGCSSELSNEYVTVKKYKGLEVAELEKTEVTDSDVENAIAANLSYSQEKIEVTDRAAEMGDVVDIDYTGSIDGVEFDGGTAEGASLELGSGSFIGAEGEYKGFEEQVAGHKKGEEFDITVKFPDDYAGTDVAGKVAKFHITLNGIYQLEETELTDEWVAQNSEESTTVEEYKEEIREQLEENNEQTWVQSMQAEVLTALADQIEVKSLPQEEVDKNIAQLEEYYQQMAVMSGVEFEEFLTSYMGMTEEQFAEKAKESAEDYVAQGMALELIAEKEKLTVTDKEYEEQVKEMASEYGFGEDIDGFVENYGEEIIRKTLTEERVLEFLVDECVQVEAE